MKEENNIGKHIVDHLQDKADAGINDSVLHNWLETSDENKQYLSKYKKIWNGVNLLAQRRKFDPDKAWGKVDSAIEKRAASFERLKISLLSTAAAVFFILFGVSFYFYWVTQNAEEPLKLVTELGSRSEATLPDGTIVKLNAGSELAYRYDKHKKVRSVQFSGEGYFEVEKNKKPFVIELQNGLSIKVLGTKFNLSAYPDDAVVKTTLTEGKVEIKDSQGEKLILAPGQIAAFSKKSGELSYSEETASHNLSWMEKKLYMDNMSLAEVCKVLERWYDVQIKITKQEMGKSIHYTGILREKSINDVFEALNGISEIEYKIKGRNIVVSEKK